MYGFSVECRSSWLLSWLHLNSQFIQIGEKLLDHSAAIVCYPKESQRPPVKVDLLREYLELCIHILVLNLPSVYILYLSLFR